MVRPLQTKRLLLRDFAQSDLNDFAHLWMNKGFARFSGGNGLSRKQSATLLERILARTRSDLPSQFAIIPRENPCVIGFCGFFLQNVDDHDELEIAYRLHPAHWGQGFATEAAQAVRDYAFGELKIPRVISLIHPANTASRRVAEKNGMTLEKEITFRGFPTLVYKVERSNGGLA
jgi:[ribosomal protein S5]-alanine N-acetyltransferase